jgi:D-psicose/D-tagatose/L-ribulose 3-epimerase
VEGDHRAEGEVRRLADHQTFGRGLPALAAATRVWRDFAESPEAVYRDGYRFIRRSWDAA